MCVYLYKEKAIKMLGLNKTKYDKSHQKLLLTV